MIESTNPSSPGFSGEYTSVRPSALAAFADVLPMQATAGQVSNPAMCAQALYPI